MKFDKFAEKFFDLDTETKVSIFNKWCENNASSEECLHEFTEEFLQDNFESYMDLVKAMCDGNLNYYDDYVHFDVWGDLKGVSESDVDLIIDEYLEDIYADTDLWDMYIDD